MHMKYFLSCNEDWFKVTLDLWVHRHKTSVAIHVGGNKVEKVNQTLDFDV